MTLRILGPTTLTVVVAAAALAGSAAAIPTAEEDAPASETFDDIVWEETQSDLTIECPPDADESSMLAEASRDTTFVTATARASSGDSTAEASDSGGDACATGASRPSCRKVTVKVRKRTLFSLSLAFEWVVVKEWCWNYPRVTWWQVRTYATHVDRYMVYRGIVSRFDDYFRWCCFSARSGHASYRMGRFENCIPIKGCIGSWYPRVQINVHGNGSYSVPVKAV